ncbi:MAG: Trk system potassium uptake protein TrkA [uncultured Thermomicrobiales bacterium]|uniref:Trk system potassium uptake protein TrkA n=1 Tax=uncultured Thermomicrobiales bacterium TaxID=1645740 RepID=A0A6J4UNG9_9BACT|nr:MAG: Trk system potassium uptake protein TrkA [uncultured Thermomicrobiales bacterium]
MFRRQRDQERQDRVVVIGLGRFGTSTARTLASLGYEVLGIDIDERPVTEASDFVTLAAQGDGTDEELLRSLHVEESDVGIVAQGENLAASVLATMVLKQIGVPWVISKAANKLHGDVLTRIGADRVIFPEADAGIRLGHSLAVRTINDYITLTPTAGLAKMHAPQHFIGRSLADLYNTPDLALSVLLIRRKDQLITAPSYTEQIEADDEIVVAGTDAAINRFSTIGQHPKGS